MAGIMQLLGLHVPQPEVEPDESNPKGFAEPQWVVDFHERLLADAVVTINDSRPSAWFETGRIATREPERIRAAEWLEGHLAEHPELVVKDPRLSWFLGLWRVAALRSGAVPVFATMLRPPAEVVGSKQKYYRNRLGSAHLAASWLNMLLHTERATRDSVADGGRVFVRYADLLDDWTRVTMAGGRQLGPAARPARRLRADPRRAPVHRPEPAPGRPRPGRPGPAARGCTSSPAQTWAELNKLADPGGDTPEVHATLDQLRESYVALYEEAEAISKSSVVAATTHLKRRPAAAPGPGGPGVGGGPDPARRPGGDPAGSAPRPAQDLRPEPLRAHR